MGHLADRLSRRLVGAYAVGSLSDRMRQRRWGWFAAAFPDLGDMHVLDIGGDARAWLISGLRPAHLTLLNLFEQPVREDWISVVVGDACDPSVRLPAADVVYSNSVIEHVGGHWRRKRYAETVRRASDRYWVQTPNRYFPVEPHFLCPALQHLPRAAQALTVTVWPVGNYRHLSAPDVALEAVQGIELIGAAELRAYFPDAAIRRERLAGLTKSLIAVRS
jgi:hypothetical protein